MKKIFVILLLAMPLLASAQSYFYVESNGETYSFPLESTTITIKEKSENSDKPTEEAVKSKIVGSWRSVHTTGWVYDDYGNLEYVDKDIPEGIEWLDYNQRIDFKSDGTYCSYAYSEEYGWEICDKDGTYQILGNVLTTRYEDKYGVYIGSGIILSISDDTLILESILEVEGTQYKSVVTFKRIK